MPLDLKATGPLPEEDASSKRQVNRLHKSRPSDLSYMKGRHHLKWHRFRKDRSPDWRRRRDCLEDVGIRVARTISPTGTALVDPFDGGFVSNPPLVTTTRGSATLAEVAVVLTTDPRHNRLEAGQLVFEVFDRIVQNVQFRGLLSHHLTKVASLTKS